MRLICPNCDAQYEVGDDAIPPSGRDVQCSNCGHGWFQMPNMNAGEETDFGSPEVLGHHAASRPREVVAEPTAVEPEVAEPAAPEPSPAPVMVEMPEPAATPASEHDEEEEGEPATPPPAPRRSLDESLLAVLREEAALEATQRKAETARPIETQPDLGLSEPEPRPRPALRSVTATPEPEAEETEAAAESEPAKAGRSRDLLPDIEEINSTLRASNERRTETEDLPAPAEEQRGGFRTGFFLMLAVAAGLAAAYVMAPKIADQIPASASAMQAYVAKVDQGRVWLDGLMRSAISALQGLQG